MSSVKHDVQNNRMLIVRQSLRMKGHKKSRGMTQMDFVGIDAIEQNPNDPNRCTMTMWGSINFGSWMPSNVFFHGLRERMEAQHKCVQRALIMRQSLGILDKEPDDSWGKAVMRSSEDNETIENMVLNAKRVYFGGSMVPDPAPLDSDTEYD